MEMPVPDSSGEYSDFHGNGGCDGFSPNFPHSALHLQIYGYYDTISCEKCQGAGYADAKKQRPP